MRLDQLGDLFNHINLLNKVGVVQPPQKCLLDVYSYEVLLFIFLLHFGLAVRVRLV